MKLKGNSFFAFWFSLIPGAGQMYMGFMKQGMTLMSTLLLLIVLSIGFNTPIFLIAIPVLWFYSFFDVHHKRALPEEEFIKLEDVSFLNGEVFQTIEGYVGGKSKVIIAGVLIFLGIYILYQNLLDGIYLLFPMLGDFAYVLREITSRIPSILIALAIIYVGYRMIVNKKKEMDDTTNEVVKEKDYREYFIETRNEDKSEI